MNALIEKFTVKLVDSFVKSILVGAINEAVSFFNQYTGWHQFVVIKELLEVFLCGIVI